MTHRRLPALVLLLIVAGSLVVRSVHFAAIRHAALIDFPIVADQSDMWGYWTWSSQILAGDLWGRNPWHPYMDWMAAWGSPEDWLQWWGGRLTFQSEPFYPYFIAALRWLGASLPVAANKASVTTWLVSTFPATTAAG